MSWLEQYTDLLYDEPQIMTAVDTLAANANQLWAWDPEPTAALVIESGGWWLAKQLVPKLHEQLHTEIMSVRVSSYGMLFHCGDPQLRSQVPSFDRYKRVLIIDDILDTGKTLDFVLSQPSLQGKQVVCCVLATKRLVQPAVPLLAAITVPDNAFIIGCGMDFGGEYRNIAQLRKMKA